MLKALFPLLAVSSIVQCSPAKYGKRRVPRSLADMFSYPGTYWCGPGDTGNNYYDIGYFSREDQCCRTHDSCPDYILPNESKHNLYNEGVFTRLTCKCDYEFKECLTNIDSFNSQVIHFLYFKLLDPICFKKDFKFTGCVLRDKKGTCIWYLKDYTSEERYRFFNTNF